MKTTSRIICMAIAVVSMATISGAAQAGTVTVQATSDIWLAGQPAGATVTGFFGADTAWANSPVLLVPTGPTLTFAATGSTSVDGSCFAGPGGGCYTDQSGFSPSPWSGLYNGPADALIGVFLNSSPPTLGAANGYQGPLSFVSGLDYQNPANIGAGSYTPALNQIFLIGDGSGETFTTPTGATRLFLGVADSIGGSTGNAGSLSVDFTGATAVPEPAAWVMMLIGFGGLGAAMRLQRRQAAASA